MQNIVVGADPPLEEQKCLQDFQPGQKVLCQWTDGKYHPAFIIEKKSQPTDSSDIESNKCFVYYIHYDGFDKRLDKWTTAETLLSEESQDLYSTQQQTQSVQLTRESSQIGQQKRMTRHAYRKQDEINPTNQEFVDTNPEIKELEKRHQETTRIRNVEKIYFGIYEVNTWYFSPYPEEYGHQSVLYICEFCLKYMRKQKTWVQHKDKCKYTRPPGNSIYFDRQVKELNDKTQDFEEQTYINSVSVYQVDGVQDKLYCQNLCLLAKLFLDHKTLYYDVSPFLFYILTEDNKYGSHIVGYFSKEKTMSNDYNLACIMVLPPYQRRGYGKFLINLSYQLSQKEGRVCTPERPLSDMGKVSYKSYWTDALLEALMKFKGNISIKEMSEHTCIKVDDIIQTLSSLNLVRYWKGQYVVTNFSVKLIEDHFKKKEEQSMKNPRQPLKFKSELVIL